MNKLFSKQNELVNMAESRIKNRWVLLVLILLYPILSQLFTGFLLPFILIPYFTYKGIDLTNPNVFGTEPMVILSSFAGSMLFYFIVVKLVDKNKFRNIGFPFKKGWISEYLIGFLIGILMMGVSFLLIVAFGGGSFKFNGISFNYLPTFMFIIFTWMVQGATEEIMMRGYALPLIGKRFNVPLGIVITSLVFSGLHLANNGIDTLPLINLALFGVFAAIYALYRGNIWGICALHSAWNFAQGNVWGMAVSGGVNMGKTLVETTYGEGNIINGGAFGPEGGLTVTFVLVVGIIIILLLKKREEKTEA